MPYTFYEMKRAVVGIAGLGGLGSNVATALARLGVGKLILVDFDVIEESNLNRQQYYLDQIGQPKVEASLTNLSRMCENTEFVIKHLRLEPGNIPEVFGEADVIAECFDLPDQKQMLVETVLTEMDKPIVVSVSGLAGVGKSNSIVTRKINDRHVLVGDGENGVRPGIPLAASRVGVAAYHQANAIAETIVNGMKVPDFGS
jgi:sulfur carrier protein ThiS adenylyltransferase